MYSFCLLYASRRTSRGAFGFGRSRCIAATCFWGSLCAKLLKTCCGRTGLVVVMRFCDNGQVSHPRQKFNVLRSIEIPHCWNPTSIVMRVHSGVSLPEQSVWAKRPPCKSFANRPPLCGDAWSKRWTKSCGQVENPSGDEGPRGAPCFVTQSLYSNDPPEMG